MSMAGSEGAGMGAGAGGMSKPPLPRGLENVRGSKTALAAVAAKRRRDKQRRDAAQSLQADGMALRGMAPGLSSTLPSEHLQPGVGLNRTLLADAWVAANGRYSL